MVQGGGRIEAGKAGAAPAAAEDVTKDPRVVAAFGRTGFFDPFYAFGVDELAPGGAATAAGTEAEADARPVLLYLPGGWVVCKRIHGGAPQCTLPHHRHMYLPKHTHATLRRTGRLGADGLRAVPHPG